MGDLTIGKAAGQAGVKISTIRFYERRGLITQPRKPEGGFRTYSEKTIRRVRFIRQAQDIGFSLAEIEDLLSLEAAEGANCGDVRERAVKKKSEVQGKIEQLTRIGEALDELIAACPGEGTLHRCGILEALRDRHHRDTDAEKKPGTDHV